jgi:TP901-1 family phage major tail protein
MSIQKGRAIFVKLSEEVILGATNHSLDISPEYEEYETKDTTGKQRSFKGFTGTVSIEGLMETTGTGLGASDVLALATTGEAVDVSIVGIPGKTSTTYTATAWITAFSIGAPVDGNATYNATLTFNDFE